jgi:hypothetical protein
MLSNVLLDLGEALAVNPRCAAVDPTALEGKAQNVTPIDLVVQGVEPIVGRVLRLGVQRRL